MKLAPLKFKNYTWPHNPATYSMTYTKNTATHSYPFTVYSDVEDLGLAPREVSGEGEFIGPNAYEEFKKKHPDANVTATFFVNGGIFNQNEYNEKISYNVEKVKKNRTDRCGFCYIILSFPFCQTNK